MSSERWFVFEQRGPENFDERCKIGKGVLDRCPG